MKKKNFYKLKISEDKYRIRGNKRGIGNKNQDSLIIWAINMENKKIL